MSTLTSIQWTQRPGTVGRTWNPVTGCTKVSPGCKFCYAETHAKRFWGDRPFTEVRCHPDRLDDPLRWRKPSTVFVNSMSDLFHEAVPDDFLDSVFAVMALTPQHTYQILTKRPARMLAYFGDMDDDMDDRAMGIGASIGDFFDVPSRRKIGEPLINLAHGFDRDAKDWDSGHGEQTLLPLANVWLGVSVEDQATADERTPLLMKTPAALRFLSVEPLLEPVDLFSGGLLHDFDWVIVGGESGPGARPCNIEWIREVLRQCDRAGVPPFLKQIGSRPEFGELWAKWLENGGAPILRHSKGGDPAEWPKGLRVREFPDV